jgi:large subunit ribosomal protein L13
MKKTFTVKKDQLEKKWYVIDASGIILELVIVPACYSRGKKKEIFSPHIDTGDNLIIINASKVKVSGNKEEDKKYFHHSWYPGGLKTTTYREAFEKDPGFVIRHAIEGMLPKNKMQNVYISKLRIYNDGNHGQEAQKPIEVKVEENR